MFYSPILRTLSLNLHFPASSTSLQQIFSPSCCQPFPFLLTCLPPFPHHLHCSDSLSIGFPAYCCCFYFEGSCLFPLCVPCLICLLHVHTSSLISSCVHACCIKISHRANLLPLLLIRSSSVHLRFMHIFGLYIIEVTGIRVRKYLVSGRSSSFSLFFSGRRPPTRCRRG